jgi:hypothetical protein
MGAMEADLHAIERDLQAIRERAVAAPGEKPVVSDTAGADSSGDDSSATREVDVRGFFDDKPRPLVGSGGGVAGEEATTDDDAGPDAELVDAGASSGAPSSESSSEPASDSAEAPKAATGERTGTIDLFGAEQEAVASATLDDDSFFASLRDAVRDDAPLGPRDESERAFFDQDDSKDSPNFREAFKRRR